MLDATAQAELVRAGQATPRELVEAAIARIDTRADLGAVAHFWFERALEEADRTLPDGPFRGVPTLVKDLGALSAGDPYQMGSRALQGFHARHDSHVTVRLREAGFIILGRTKSPEFGTDVTTEPAVYGPARNPWNPEYSTGGSSGGSGAAVAGGMVPLAHASDGGGSIRIPASLCGLIGLKATRGRVSLGPELAEGWAGFATAGALTSSVRDCAAVYDVLSGRMPGDPYDAPALPGPLTSELTHEPGRLKIGYVTGPAREDLPDYPVCRDAVATAVKALRERGHEVEPSSPPALHDPAFPEHFGMIVAINVAAEIAEVGAVRGRAIEDDELELRNQIMGKVGRRIPATDYLASLRWIAGYRRRMAAWWSEYDLLVTPTVGAPPYRLGWLPADDFGTAMARTAQVIQYTAPFNATGQPAISLPLHTSEDRMPVGVQLVADTGREDLLIRVAAQLL